LPIDILAQIGFVVLVGLAAKNAILIVEFARQKEEDGAAAGEAAVHAARTRLRPILMTSFAFILGVAPLAVATGAGGEMRRSLGTAVLFGMLGVTGFGLLFTPAFYTFIRIFGRNRKERELSQAALKATAIILALSLFAGGCAVGPRYKAPQPAPAQFHSAEAQLTTTAPFDERWWKQFEDPVLDDLMEKALVANNDIHIARARLVEARSVYDERKFDRYPIVPADVSYSYAKQQIPGFFNDRYTVNTFRAGLDAAWEVDLFGRVRHEVAAARSDTQAAAADLHYVQVSVAAELALNYFQLRGAQWRLDVARRQLENQKHTLDLTKLRRDAGVGDEQDVASAAARVADTDASIPPLVYEVARAQYRLAVLTGVRPGELSADLSPRKYSPIDKAIPIGDAAELLHRRPDIQAAERRLSAATERQGEAVAGLYPNVSISSFIGFLAGRGSLFFTPSSFATTISPAISWSAFDLGRARARVRGAGGATDEALATYNDTVLRALEETENAFTNYRTQQQRLIKLDTEAQESKRYADIARLRYKEGVIDFLQLLDAERTQLQAEDQVAQSESGVYIAVVSIYKAIGGGPS
jgi:multidrug efflux system outer membrane protein